MGRSRLFHEKWQVHGAWLSSFNVHSGFQSPLVSPWTIAQILRFRTPEQVQLYSCSRPCRVLAAHLLSHSGPGGYKYNVLFRIWLTNKLPISTLLLGRVWSILSFIIYAPNQTLNLAVLWKRTKFDIRAFKLTGSCVSLTIRKTIAHLITNFIILALEAFKKVFLKMDHMIKSCSILAVF